MLKSARDFYGNCTGLGQPIWPEASAGRGKQNKLTVFVCRSQYLIGTVGSGPDVDEGEKLAHYPSGMLGKLSGNLPAGALVTPIGKLVDAQAEFTGTAPSGVRVSTAGCWGAASHHVLWEPAQRIAYQNQEEPFLPACPQVPSTEETWHCAKKKEPRPSFAKPKKGEFETEGQ